MSKNKEKVEEILDFVNGDFTFDEEVNVPTEVKNLTVRVVDHANLRPYPNHTSTKIKMFKDGLELEVIDIVEGSLVQGGNTWYKVEGGFIHFSQVKEVEDYIKNV